jgi:uncharacterized protein (DUF58 family)
MVRPGPRQLRARLALCGAALLVPLAPALAPLLAAGLAAAALAAGAEARRLARLDVRVEREAALVLSRGAAATVAFGIAATGADGHRGGARPQPVLRLRVRQVWPALLDRPAGHAEGLCRPGELLRCELPVRAVARGSARLEPPWVAASIGGWAERIVAAAEPRPAELTVLPDLEAVRRLRSRLDQLYLRGLGTRVSPRLGKGRDFDRLREYVTGDDFRDVAWKASAHHGKLITREYRLDRSQEVVVCIDRGHRMAARVAHLTRLDHAVNAAVLVASIAGRMEDRSGVLSFADAVEPGIAQGRGTAHLRRLTGFAARLAPELRHTDYLALAGHLRRRLRSRALILVFTALPELAEEGELVRATGMLISQHLPLIVVFSDPDLAAAARMLPAGKADLCRTLVARDLGLERRRVIADLRRRGALVVEAPPGEIGLAAVNGYLEIKRRQLL